LVSPVYYWIFNDVYNIPRVYQEELSFKDDAIKTQKVILLFYRDEGFLDKPIIGILYDKSKTLRKFYPPTSQYDLDRYPYTSLKSNYEGKATQKIRMVEFHKLVSPLDIHDLSSLSEQKNLGNKYNISKATGNFGSLQNDLTGKPAWIVVGRWMMNVSQGGAITLKNPNPNPNPTPNSATFNATLNMVKLDGTSKHKHTISDFKLISSSINKNISATFNGTATITMKEGPVKDVPISIKFRDSGAASLWVDPVKTQKHFGNTPIYSFVWKTH
jgi:hypothetical protein